VDVVVLAAYPVTEFDRRTDVVEVRMQHSKAVERHALRVRVVHAVELDVLDDQAGADGVQTAVAVGFEVLHHRLVVTGDLRSLDRDVLRPHVHAAADVQAVDDLTGLVHVVRVGDDRLELYAGVPPPGVARVRIAARTRRVAARACS
jgi:hypothetical protein